MSLLQERVSTDFSSDSGLADEFPNYTWRSEQTRLAAVIVTAMEQKDILLAEAETGTGKTLAYLVPAIRSSQKTLISTHTRALQDQLVSRDLPAVMRALRVEKKIALLKGRSNYICPHHLNQKLRDHHLTPPVRQLLQDVSIWSEGSPDGDLSFLEFDVFDAGIGGMVTSTAEQCLGRNCPEWERCPLAGARARTRDADIVITNHSLLLADAALKSGEFGEILPLFDVYILDEAQSIPDLASQHFGLQLTSQRFSRWGNDMEVALEELGDEMALQREINLLVRALLPVFSNSGLADVLVAWRQLVALADSRVERNQDLLKLARRAEEIGQQIEAIMQPAGGFVAWSEGDSMSKRYCLAPIETGPLLEEHLWGREAAFILLSASLRVSDKFTYAKGRLGLPDAKEATHTSPFNYSEQALIYVPEQMPAPRSDGYEEKLLAEMEALLTASQGRAFVLFTSHRVLAHIAPVLASRLPWRVLVQGKDGTNDKIMSIFQEDTSSILCGTRSFWEGVDVPGDALSMVIIEKIPFAPPDDPLLNERIKLCNKQGGNGFRDIQLPEAVATLKQGLGRLIRSPSDRGVMALLDSRVHTKSYGREVLRNFPPAPRTSKVRDVLIFFQTADDNVVTGRF